MIRLFCIFSILSAYLPCLAQKPVRATAKTVDIILASPGNARIEFGASRLSAGLKER